MQLNYKRNTVPQAEPRRLGTFRRIGESCLRCYQAAQGRLARVKAELEREFGRAMAGNEQMLRASVNEAEALAWQTPYPYLLFPVLAQEKASEALDWAVRQRQIRERSESLAFAV